jgi:AraC-like DNA-binding protein
VSPYRERPAAPTLARRLACVWDFRHEGPAQVKAVVPDACIDLIWSSYDQAVHVAGPDTEPFPAALRPGEQFAAVRFRPGAAAEVLGLPARAIRDSRVMLSDLWGREADRIAENVAAAGDPSRTLEALVANRVAAAGPRDRAATGTLQRLASGNSVPALAAELGYSERHLLRRCHEAFGYGPKTLQRILRFQRALRLIGAGFALVDTATATGYADQAHLAREVSRLAGMPPSGLVA